MIYHGGHLGARAEFAGLSLRGKDRDLRQREVIENNLRHVRERPRRVMLEHKQTVIRPDALHFRLQRRGDAAGDGVGDNRDSLLRFQSQTGIDRVARAREQFRINWMEINAIGHN